MGKNIISSACKIRKLFIHTSIKILNNLQLPLHSFYSRAFPSALFGYKLPVPEKEENNGCTTQFLSRRPWKHLSQFSLSWVHKWPIIILWSEVSFQFLLYLHLAGREDLVTSLSFCGENVGWFLWKCIRRQSL